MAFRRRPVNKRKSAKTFRKQVTKTQRANVVKPARGGYRM